MYQSVLNIATLFRSERWCLRRSIDILRPSRNRRNMNLSLPQPFADALASLCGDVSEPHGLMLDVLASIVHPDMVCSIFALRSLPLDLKVIAVQCIDYALAPGLTPEQAATLYRAVEPKIAARF